MIIKSLLLEKLIIEHLRFEHYKDERRVHFREEMGTVRDLSRLPLSRINKLVNIVCEAKSRMDTGVTPSFTIEIMLHKMKEIS